MFTAHNLTEKSRAAILAQFPPLFPKVIAHHITVDFGVSKGTSAPETATVEVIGHAFNESIQAVVVKVDGTTNRPDGKIFHITISLDDAIAKPFHSNALVAAGWDEVEPLEVETTPAVND